jgi:Glycosyl transferase family 2
MLVGDVPDEVRLLARQREERRSAGEYRIADELRDRIRALGFDVVDTPAGPELNPAAPAPARRVRPQDVGSVLDRPARFDASVQWVVQGWPEDAVRGIGAFRRHHQDRSVQVVVVDAAGTDPAAWPDDAEVVALDRDPGWAAARNVGLRRAAGRLVVVVDGSVEPTGDVIGPLEQALTRPRVGLAGPFGLVTADLREFSESRGIGRDRQVDAIEGYLMAFPREVIGDVGGFDEGFKFYRSADLDFSFRVRDRGFMAVMVDVPVERHEHRMWASLPEGRRASLSRRNFYRFLDRWRGRDDLSLGRRGSGDATPGARR